jgi:dTDP-4-amino-4,6-dideoxygalactose transaminase
VTESIADSIISLPMFPHMTEEMVDYVCSELKSIL